MIPLWIWARIMSDNRAAIDRADHAAEADVCSSYCRMFLLPHVQVCRIGGYAVQAGVFEIAAVAVRRAGLDQRALRCRRAGTLARGVIRAARQRERRSGGQKELVHHSSPLGDIDEAERD